MTEATAAAAHRLFILEDQELVAKSFCLVLRKHAPGVAASVAQLAERLDDIRRNGVVIADVGEGADRIWALLTERRPDLAARLIWKTGAGSSLQRYGDIVQATGRPVFEVPIPPLELRALVQSALDEADAA
jgi:hypothetical protein